MAMLSIIIPTYNQAQYIKETLDSILRQQFDDYEIIVVDDGSTDLTRGIVFEYIAKYTDKIKLIVHPRNMGLSSALNTGLRECERGNSEFITWISSDSYYVSGALSTLVGNMMVAPKEVGVVFTDFIVFGPQGQSVLSRGNGGRIGREEMLQRNWVGASFIFRKECYKKIGYYSVDLETVEDWDYWIRISEHYKLRHVPCIGVMWRDHPGSMSHTKAHLKSEKTWLMMEKARARIARGYDVSRISGEVVW
jgi:glycosyltransferase involved in cell wall biosynthesis